MDPGKKNIPNMLNPVSDELTRLCLNYVLLAAGEVLII
jgi:hypothetical protein